MTSLLMTLCYSTVHHAILFIQIISSCNSSYTRNTIMLLFLHQSYNNVTLRISIISSCNSSYTNHIIILQRIGVAQATVSERWPYKEEKMPENKIFSLGSIPEVGQKQKTEKKKKERKRRAKVGNNNGQLSIATPPRVAHAKQNRLTFCVHF